MKKATAMVVSVLMAIVAVRYCYFIVTGEVRPILATWMLFSLAVCISMWTYLRADTKKDWVTNIANTTDVFATCSIFIFLLLFGKDIRYGFTAFEAGCILAVGAVLVYWRISKRAGIANIAINVILVIGYMPTIVALWGATVNTESISVWAIAFISSLVSLYNPIREKDWLALLYASRATVFVGTILCLIIKIELFK